MALSYKALVTLAEFRANIFNADATAADTSHNDAIDDVIENVTERIEAYLRRRLIVRRHRDYYESLNWFIDRSQNQESDTVKSVYLQQWPVVQVIDILPSDVTNPSIHNDGRRVYTTDTNLSEAYNGIEEVEYYAGYKRADQTDLSTIQADNGATDLSELTAGGYALLVELPWDIRQVANRLCLYEIANIASGTIGIGPTVQEVATATLNMQGPREDFVDRELMKIAHHRAWV